MLEIEGIKEKISSLDESEAKSLLMIFYGRIDTAVKEIVDMKCLNKQ